MNFEFDEYFYLRRYPDVRMAVLRGKFRSGVQHYRECGRGEGRQMNPISNDEPRIFVSGAYGTNNVGDEAIFEGILQEYPSAIQLYLNAPRILNAISVWSMIRGENKFRHQDTLIIGGGGLLYGPEAIQVMIDLCEAMRRVGGVVKIMGLGCEGAQASYYEKIQKLFSFTEEITVRTTISQEIIKKVANLHVAKQDDFAFRLNAKLPRRTKPRGVIKRVGIVTGGDSRSDVLPLAKIIRRYGSESAPSDRIQFVHIPHSASHIDFYNNDVAVGLKLRTVPNIFLDCHEMFFDLLPFTGDPYEVLKTYADLDAVMSERFHGIIFGHITNIPTLALGAGNLKNRSLVEDYPRHDLFISKSEADIEGQFEKLLAAIPT